MGKVVFNIVETDYDVSKDEEKYQKYQAKKDEVQVIHDRIQTIEKILFSNDPDLRDVLDDV